MVGGFAYDNMGRLIRTTNDVPCKVVSVYSRVPHQALALSSEPSWKTPTRSAPWL